MAAPSGQALLLDLFAVFPLSLFDALANARFSAESQGFAQFAGPTAIRFESLQVAGEG